MWERIIKLFFKGISFFSSFLVIVIFIVLVIEAIPFFKEVSILEFLGGTEWFPLFTSKKFGVLPLLWGTYFTTILASIITIPVGCVIAIYLSEYALPKVRGIIISFIEILAMIPSIVYGYFALIFITPFLSFFFSEIEIFNVLSASIAMGIMMLPLMISLTYDLLRGTSDELRYGAYALGATKLYTAIKILIPARFREFLSIITLVVTRAVGETMVVTIAAGQLPQITLSPLKSAQTMCSYIANTVMGEIPHGTLEYYTVYAVGTLLLFNIIILTIGRIIIQTRK